MVNEQRQTSVQVWLKLVKAAHDLPTHEFHIQQIALHQLRTDWIRFLLHRNRNVLVLRAGFAAPRTLEASDLGLGTGCWTRDGALDSW